MQKSPFSPKAEQAPVVQFSKLDENNKAQFLQFLIKNNITFDNAAGKQNVVAKVTLKTLTPNKNVNNKTTINQALKNGSKNIKKPLHYNDKLKIQDKQNNENFTFSNTRKSAINNKDDIQNKSVSKLTSIITQKKAPQPACSFRKVNKPLYNYNNHQEQNIKNPNKAVRDSSISLKKVSQNREYKMHTKTMNVELRERTPDKRNITLASPSNANKRIQDKSSEKLISIKDSNLTPARSVRNTSFTKESHQRLSDFKKENLPYTMRQSCLLQQQKEITKNKPKQVNPNQRQKVRDKVIVQQQKLNDSHGSISFSREKLGNSSKEKLNLCGNSLRNYSFESLNRIQLVNKYKEYFNNFSYRNGSSKANVASCIRQRPVCWPLTQVEKFLDEFYDDNFIKNTNQILNGSKKLNESLKKGVHSKSSHLAQSLEKFLHRKFNGVQKSIQYNLINLLYSVAFYINQQKEIDEQEENGSIIELRLFEDFLSQQFDLEDYLFFLFCRNILKQDFKKTFIPSSVTVNINKKEIDRFLKHIVGQNNTEILEQYHHMIFQKVPTFQIQVNKFMRILIDDYKVKRQAAELSHRQKTKHQKYSNKNYRENQILQEEDSSLENTFNKILCLDNRNDPRGNIFDNSGQIVHQDSMQELTFGQDTKDMLRQVDIETKDHQQVQQDQYQFWQSPYISEKNTKMEKQRLLKDDFNQMIVQKLCQKTHELVELLSNSVSANLQNTNKFQKHYKNNQNQRPQEYQTENSDENDTYEENQYQQVQQLLFSKALCLFFTVIQMNKVKWLKELYISNPTQDDIEKVQEIQLYFRKIKEYPTAKDIAEFCKLILTVTQITEQLSRFFL